MRLGDAALTPHAVLGWFAERNHVALLALVALLCALHVFIAPHFALFGDVGAYLYWGQLTRDHFFHVYSLGAQNSNWVFRPNYGPVAMYLFAVTELVYFAVAPALGLSMVQSIPTNGALTAYMKLPALAAHCITIAVLYALARRRLPARWIIPAVATYALCPALLLDIMVWGQTDSIIMLGLLLALLCAQHQRGTWVGILFALTVFFKSQPIIFLPIALLYLLRWGGVRHAAAAVTSFLVTSLLVWMPYLLPPRPEIQVWKQMLGVLANARPYASDGALNLWWLLGPHHNPNEPMLGPISANLLGLFLLVIFMCIACIAVWRDGSPARLWLGSGLIAGAFFTVMTLQRERYELPALVLLFVAAVYVRKGWLFYGAVAFAATFNIASVVFFLPPQQIGNTLNMWATGLISHFPLVYVALTLAAVGMNLWLVLMLAVVLLRSGARDLHPQTAQTATRPVLSG